MQAVSLFFMCNFIVFTSTPRDKHSHFTDKESEAQRLQGMPKATQFGAELGVSDSELLPSH